MGQVVDFKCPSCGGYVEFQPTRQQFKCLYCGKTLSEEELSSMRYSQDSGVNAAEDQQEEVPEREPGQQTGDGEESVYRAYHCHSCGAQIVTTETTAATRCYYCHNPVVLQDRLEGEFKPDGVIPFALDKAGAEEAFKKFIKSKKYVDRRFYSEAQLKEFTGVYYPYWFCDIEGDATFKGTGTRVNVVDHPIYIEKITRYFRVEREGRVTFRDMFRKALRSADRSLSEGIHPYQTKVQPFRPGVLSGFMAEMRDVDEEDAFRKMLEDASGQVHSLMLKEHDFHSLTGDSGFRMEKHAMRYVLLPAWVLTWKHNKSGEMYYYMMNGENGNVCGRLPVDKRKLFARALCAGAAVFALLCAGGALLW